MNNWDKFFQEKIIKIFTENKVIVDIGGGLRAIQGRGNRFDPARAWIGELIKKVDYKILDPVAEYSPDIVGDIHNLPLADNSQDAIICLAVLEHVENPFLASQEIFRVIKPGGQVFIYVPFLFYYHAEKGYYSDYWRFTRDGVELLFKNFTHIEIESVRGRIGTWIHLSPLGKLKIIAKFATFLDKFTGGFESSQVSGFNVFLVK